MEISFMEKRWITATPDGLFIKGDEFSMIKYQIY